MMRDPRIGGGTDPRTGGATDPRTGGATDPRASVTPRVKAGIWVSMALRVGNADGRYGAVIRKGDPDAGGVLVVLRNDKQVSVLSQIRSGEGELAWMRATGLGPVDDETADAYIARQVKFDPDLWVIEFEAPDLLPPFEAKVL
jgi:hypothetical protein